MINICIKLYTLKSFMKILLIIWECLIVWKIYVLKYQIRSNKKLNNIVSIFASSKIIWIMISKYG